MESNYLRFVVRNQQRFGTLLNGASEAADAIVARQARTLQSSIQGSTPEVCLHDEETISMAKTTFRKRVPEQARRKNRDHKGLPQMMVAVSALPEFGGRACSLTTAYKFCDGHVVSARLARVMKEAMRRLRSKERAA